MYSEIIQKAMEKMPLDYGMGSSFRNRRSKEEYE